MPDLKLSNDWTYLIQETGRFLVHTCCTSLPCKTTRLVRVNSRWTVLFDSVCPECQQEVPEDIIKKALTLTQMAKY